MTYPRVFNGGVGYAVDGPPVPGATVPIVQWAANTRYPAGFEVVAPTGQIVQANSAFTSGGSYNPANWTVVNDVGAGGGGGSVTKSAVIATGVLATDLGGAADLLDVPVSSAGQLSAGVHSNVTAVGTYTAPAPAGSVGTPPQRFGIRNLTTSPVAVSFPNNSGTTITPTLLPGESRIYRQTSTSGYSLEQGIPLAQEDYRFRPFEGQFFPIRKYGAKCNGIRVLDAATTAAQPTVTSASYNFTAADVGKTVGVAMPVGTLPDVWIGVIQSISGGVATLDSNAPSSVTGAECSFGTPDDAAFAAALADATAAGGGSIVVPANVRTIVTGTLTWANGVDLIGATRETSIITVIRNGLAWITAANGWTATNNQPLTGCRFEHFKIEARLHTPGSSYSSSAKPLNIFNVRRVTVNDTWMENTPATAIPCDQSTDQCTITYNLVTNPGRTNGGGSPGGSGIGMGTASGSDNEPTLVMGNVILGDGARGQNGIFTENTITDDAAHYLTTSPGYRIIGNFVTGMKFGITDAGSLGTIIEGNTCIANRVANICVGPGTYSKGFPGRHFAIRGNYVGKAINVNNAAPNTGNDTGNGILVDLTAYTDTAAVIPANALGNGVIENNVITLNGGHGITVWMANRNATNPLDCQDLVIRNNYISTNGLSGILATYRSGLAPNGTDKALRNCTIAGNVCVNNNQAGGTNGTSTTQSGIRIETLVVNTDVIDNACYDDQATPTQAYGFFLSTSVTFIGGSFKRNRLRNNKTGNVNIVNLPGWGTGALVADNDGYTLGGPTSVTATGSPMTYTAGVSPEDLYVYGGTVSAIAKGSTTVANTTPARVSLAPGEAATITYTVAPTIVTDKR